jgi:hypothetical protein
MPPWQPGQTGNPLGRPKSIPIEARWRELLEATELDGEPIKGGRQVADLLARKTLHDALKGDAKARKEILDRVYGKVPLRIAGHDGGPVAVQMSWPDDGDGDVPDQDASAARGAGGSASVAGEVPGAGLRPAVGEN